MQNTQVTSLERYRVDIQENDLKQVTVTVVNPNFTRKYSSGPQQLIKINIEALRNAIHQKNSHITASLKEEADTLQIKVTVAIALLPSITETIKCPLVKEISQQQSNLFILQDVKNKLSQAKLLLDKSINNFNSSKTQACFKAQIMSPYDQEGNCLQNHDQNYNQTQGTITFASINVQSDGRYFVTLSFLVKKLQMFYCYRENYDTPAPAFTDTQNVICAEESSLTGFVSYIVKQIVNFCKHKNSLNYFLKSNGIGTHFKNIVLTAQKLPD